MRWEDLTLVRGCGRCPTPKGGKAPRCWRAVFSIVSQFAQPYDDIRGPACLYQTVLTRFSLALTVRPEAIIYMWSQREN